MSSSAAATDTTDGAGFGVEGSGKKRSKQLPPCRTLYFITRSARVSRYQSAIGRVFSVLTRGSKRARSPKQRPRRRFLSGRGGKDGGGRRGAGRVRGARRRTSHRGLTAQWPHVPIDVRDSRPYILV